MCEKERQAGRVREELLAHLKGEGLEPPARDRVRRIIGTALRQAEQALTARIASRIPAEAAARMIARAADPGDEEEAAPGEAGTLFSTGLRRDARDRARPALHLPGRWLRDRDLQRETESGLNVVENYNGGNDYIRFGKRGELASNRREEQELGMLGLHILQSRPSLFGPSRRSPPDPMPSPRRSTYASAARSSRHGRRGPVRSKCCGRGLSTRGPAAARQLQALMTSLAAGHGLHR